MAGTATRQCPLCGDFFGRIALEFDSSRPSFAKIYATLAPSYQGVCADVSTSLTHGVEIVLNLHFMHVEKLLPEIADVERGR